MDANNTRFHILLGKADWLRCDENSGQALQPRQPDARILRRRTAPRGTDWNERSNELTLRPVPFEFVTAPKDIAPQISDRRGSARDRYGNWYWIGRSEREIRVRSSGSEAVSRFWDVADMANHGQAEEHAQPGEFQPKEPAIADIPLQWRGLAVTDDHYLVAGTLVPPGLVIFDLHAGGGPHQMLWPAEIPFAPFDMAPRPGGGVWILDRDNKRFWALDRRFNVISAGQDTATLNDPAVDDFQPKDGLPGGEARQTGAVLFPRGIGVEAACALPDCDPIAIEGLPDGTLLILDNERQAANNGQGERFLARIRRFAIGQAPSNPITTQALIQSLAQLPGSSTGADRRLAGHDFAFIPEQRSSSDPNTTFLGRLHLVSASGNQTYACELTVVRRQAGDPVVEVLDGRWLTDFLPMRLYGGRAAVSSAVRAYYDFGGDLDARWLPIVEQRRPRYATTATVYTPAFDGRDPDCVWHRLMLDGCIPPETEVRVASRAADSPADLRLAEWSDEPPLHLRREGSELPYLPNAGQMSDCRGTWELLFQRARGQYAQLKLTLVGNGRATPSLRALRAYYPRFSYLTHYMPAVYREDDSSASFLDRFLANLEGMHTSIEDRIAAVQLLFDVRSAPPETLEWLAGWLGATLDPAWDELRRRLFIRNAMRFFLYRGTEHGLRAALRLALDDCVDDVIFDVESGRLPARARTGGIRIAERYRVQRVSRAQPREQQLATNRTSAHRFTVQLPVAASGQLNNEEYQRRIELVQRIVALEKPAHTTFDLQFYWAMFRVGEARLGEDTLIGLGSRAPELLPPMVLGQGYLAEGKLAPSHPQNVEDRTVVGRDRLDMEVQA